MMHVIVNLIEKILLFRLPQNLLDALGFNGVKLLFQSGKLLLHLLHSDSSLLRSLLCVPDVLIQGRDDLLAHAPDAREVFDRDANQRLFLDHVARAGRLAVLEMV